MANVCCSNTDSVSTPYNSSITSRFDRKDIEIIFLTWRELADRSNGKGIDQEVFLQYFPLHGLLGERLFVQFDSKKRGYIDFDDFITGLSRVCRGTDDDKIHFIFDMFSTMNQSYVCKQEMTTLLNQIPLSSLNLKQDQIADDAEDSVVEIDSFTHHSIIEKAYSTCDVEHRGRLNYEDFKIWIEDNPSIIEFILTALPYQSTLSNTKSTSTSKKRLLRL
jgi:Ca2+-binding EF-hand superfamily protein